MTTKSPTFGYVVPPSKGSQVPEAEEIWAIAEAADHSVLDHLWVSDHIVWWLPMHDAMTLVTAIAARTSRIKIGPAVLLLAMRNPVLIAKAAASIQLLSGGRLTMGVGVGGEFPPEWEAVGVSLRTRARRTDETIDAMRGLWGEAPFTMHGREVEVEAVDLHPKPAPPIPIWVGGRSDAALARAGAKGDGWMGIFTTPQRYADQLARVKRAAEDAGRDPSSVRASLYVWTSIADSTEAARDAAESLLGEFYNVAYERLAKYAVVGDPETCASMFREFRDAGVEHFAVAPIASSPTTEPLLRLTNEVMPLVTP